ncbi:MAG: MFS transporter [Solirubrobacteraceae bacterium]
MDEPRPTPSTWAPLRLTVFRWLWLASLVSNVGTWMQTVGAQWLLVHAAHAAILVSLVQTADMLPDVLFGIVGGVLADTLDRRRLLVVVQGSLVVATSALAALTIAGRITPALLLLFTFVIGSGSVLVTPAYQSLVPELVPRDQIPAAAQLSSISVNLARAIGPAIAGILIARLGVGAVFAIDAATFLFYGVVVALWRPASDTTPQIPERFVSALRAGGRYVRYAPVVRRIMLRAALFLVPASALWALLPLVASRRLGLGPGGYGLLLAALGVGAIAGASLLTRLRARLSTNALIVVVGGVFSAALVGVILLRTTFVVVLVLVPAGMAWVGMLATVNTLLQLFLPRWVRARGLSVYQMVLFGAQGLGAVVWGVVADSFGLTDTFLVAAALMALGAASVRVWPLVDTESMDRSAVVRPDPTLAFETAADVGPVVVRTTYSIPAERELDFVRAMVLVRRSRLRTGATQWGLFRDGEQPAVYEEIFVVASWEEHLRQHRERMTATDLAYEEAAKALSETPPRTLHLLPAEIDGR